MQTAVAVGNKEEGSDVCSRQDGVTAAHLVALPDVSAQNQFDVLGPDALVAVWLQAHDVIEDDGVKRPRGSSPFSDAMSLKLEDGM